MKIAGAGADDRFSELFIPRLTEGIDDTRIKAALLRCTGTR